MEDKKVEEAIKLAFVQVRESGVYVPEFDKVSLTTMAQVLNDELLTAYQHAPNDAELVDENQHLNERVSELEEALRSVKEWRDYFEEHEWHSRTCICTRCEKLERALKGEQS